MFRPTGFADLRGRRVGIFGVGVEGRATVRRLTGVAEHFVLVDDAALDDPEVLRSAEGGLAALHTCEVVIKSPGIARRRPDVIDLELHGVPVVSALNLWLHDVERARVLAITGTKGKSTTTALAAFFLECLGERALRLGNIGQPPYDPNVDTSSGWLVLEVSSFQCVDIDVAPAVVVVTSLGADHLDWHGSLEQYQCDKLALTRTPGDHRTLVPENATLRGRANQLGGDLDFVEPDATHLAAALGLVGGHSNSNVALALRAVAELTGRDLGEVRDIVRERASQFEPLRGRLTLAAREEGVGGALVHYIDDGLATSVLPTVAALEVFTDQPLSLIAGGFDRGVDYAPLARALGARSARTTVIAMGDAGARLAHDVRALAPELSVIEVRTMRDAVTRARLALEGEGIVLFSPAAASFDQYRNWEERSQDFTNIARALAHEWDRGVDSDT